MKILAIDTATEACSVALLIDGRVIARELEFERGHAEHILPMVDEVLAEGGIALAGLDTLAFGRGPGGFTGVRLAASVVQGLAFGAGLPVVPVSDLAAVAQRVADREPGLGRILICNDARMQEVYWGCFERGADNWVRLVGAEHVGPASSVTLPPAWAGGASGETTARAAGPVMPTVAGAGRGFRVYPGFATALAAQVRIVDDGLLPRATEIARLAAAEFHAGRAVPPEEALPVYLRDDVVRPPSRN